jgi:tetratricopeptide (TPR) repeat protein
MTAVGLALSLATIGTAAPAAVQNKAAPERKINISKPATKAVVELQNAVKANDMATIPAKLAAAKAVATTADDRYYIGSQAFRAGLNAKDNGLMAEGMELMLASGLPSATDLPLLYLNLGKAYNNLKQPDKAAPFLEKAIQTDPSQVEAMVMLAEMRAAAGQTADAVTNIRKAIAAQAVAGKKADENWYKRALTLAYNAKLPVAIDISRDWVKAYPSAANWKDAIRIYRNTVKPPEPVLLDLLRLARVTNALDGDVDYNAYVYIAADVRNAREGQLLLDQAAAAGKIDVNKPLFQEMLKALKTRPQPGAEILAKSAETQLAGADGAALVVTANRFYGIGDYARAAELFKAALGKPGIDKDQVNMELGIALAAAGDNAGAKAAFDAVTGQRSEIAKYWLTYLATKA